MLSTKLFTYIASTFLANTLIVKLLPPVYASPTEPIESRNTVEKLTLNPSSLTYTDGILLQDNGAEVYSTHFNQGEVIPSLFNSKGSGFTTTTTITAIEQQFLIQDFESKIIDNDVENLNSIQLDLDSILAHEFDQKGMLIARCCL
ncbi:hypothetical protein LC605_13760 [Nostoc sp. CHAB 5836]|uniref:hypothetical protein n=1 Tax=Nostoc sp. CHAB 5836 TaxID=2780404 RepID=UPI001E43029B|nr:hypothetical protein [Nostoc sp. CHAB 5836]MCC5616113.1 hypothetical protein [Nostoc sp. CHAB 5836]